MPLRLKAQSLLPGNQSMGDGWIQDLRRRLSGSCGVGESPYFLRFPPSVVGSFESGLEMAERRRGCCFSSGMGIRGSHSSTNPAVPRWPQVDSLMVEFFFRLVTMRTFSRM